MRRDHLPRPKRAQNATRPVRPVRMPLHCALQRANGIWAPLRPVSALALSAVDIGLQKAQDHVDRVLEVAASRRRAR